MVLTVDYEVQYLNGILVFLGWRVIYQKSSLDLKVSFKPNLIKSCGLFEMGKTRVMCTFCIFDYFFLFSR